MEHYTVGWLFDFLTVPPRSLGAPYIIYSSSISSLQLPCEDGNGQGHPVNLVARGEVPLFLRKR